MPPTLMELLRKTVDLQGSDLHLTTATPPQVRVDGKLQRLDLPDLERSGVRYFKIAGRTLTEQMARDGLRPKSAITREIASADVAAVFARYGVDIIAERIESEDLVLEALDLDVPYAQGHLFGAPRAIKESLMEETTPPKEFYLKQGRVA